MTWLQEQAQRWQRAIASELLVPAQTREPVMLSKSGLHPYSAALYFILRESEKKGPRSRASIVASDIVQIAHRTEVRMLANMYNKTNCDVARDLIDTYRAQEDGRQ